MKKTLIKLLSLVLALIIFGGVISSCAPAPLTESNNIELIGAVYSRGSQTVRIISSLPEDAGSIAKFKPTVSASDILLDGAFKQKTITAVEYVSKTEIHITLEGDVTIPDSTNTSEGTIYVLKTGLENDYDSYTVAFVERPAISVTAYYYSSTEKRHSCTYALPWGEFTDALGAETVTCTNAKDGKIFLQLNDNGTLTVDVVGFKSTDGSETPIIKFAPSATTFNRQITIKVASADSVVLE
jgi:hypothetical protein